MFQKYARVLIFLTLIAITMILKAPVSAAPLRDWVQVYPATSPPSISGHAMVFDASNNEIVLFQWGPETWTWDGANWTQHSPANTPVSRSSFDMAYDPIRGEVVLFGGNIGGAVVNDTWVWDGIDWTQKFPTNSPPGRHGHEMIFDTARGEIVLFGDDRGLGDTWVWDGNNWLQKFPTTSPPQRENLTMAYDETRNVTVIYGGIDPGGTLGDTWVWDGNDWTEQSPVTSPGPLNGPTMVRGGAGTGKSTVALLLADDAASSVRVVVQDPSSDVELYRSPSDLPVRILT